MIFKNVRCYISVTSKDNYTVLINLIQIFGLMKDNISKQLYMHKHNSIRTEVYNCPKCILIYLFHHILKQKILFLVVG